MEGATAEEIFLRRNKDMIVKDIVTVDIGEGKLVNEFILEVHGNATRKKVVCSKCGEEKEILILEGPYLVTDIEDYYRPLKKGHSAKGQAIKQATEPICDECQFKPWTKFMFGHLPQGRKSKNCQE
ncbi:MAG: hypothetical protein ABH889_01980 [Candidatus Portnoybacteria bacterium]